MTSRSRRARQRADQRRRRRAQFLFAGALVVLLLAGILIAIATRRVSPNGSVTDPARFDLPALSGPGRVSLAAYRGHPVVVNLFASWCTECQHELPGFAKVAAATRGQIAFVGVNSEESGDGAAMAARFHLADAGFALARDVGPSPASGLHDALLAPGMPVTAFYDAQGRLVDRSLGALAESDLRARLDRLYGTHL